MRAALAPCCGAIPLVRSKYRRPVLLRCPSTIAHTRTGCERRLSLARSPSRLRRLIMPSLPVLLRWPSTIAHTRTGCERWHVSASRPPSRLRRLIMPTLDLTARRCSSRGTIATPRRLGPYGGLSPPARRSSPAWRTLDLSAPPARESWRLLRPAACPLPDVRRSAGTPPRPGRGVAPAPAVVLRTDVRTLLPL